MRLPAAAVGSTVFFLVAPGTVALLVPWLLTDWGTGADLGVVLRGVGWLLVAVGVVGLVHSFARFVRQGRGTPAPVAPTAARRHGIYRHVRNPMYLSVIAAILGQALILGSGVCWDTPFSPRR
jgi:protein-S-isoprenylcysteine O-methyltransferase Ste14